MKHVMYFTAEWCNPCKRIKPIAEELEREGFVNFQIIDADDDELILSGAVEIAAIDSITGEPLYSFSPKIKEVMPKLYEQHMTEVNRDIMALWEKGFLNIEMLTDNPLVTLTDKAFINDEIVKIPKELQLSLSEIKRLLVK